ncbi:thiol-disulfide oxidoreductase DCC family protein [Actinomycetes bacterium M1A6_2h]
MTDRALFLYDGDCAFCSTCAQFLTDTVRADADVIAWQHADLDSLPVTQDDCENAVQWIKGGRATSGPRAIADLLRTSTGVWRLAGHALAFPPVELLARLVYRVIANNRDKLPGGTPTCALPQAERDRLA